VKKVVVTKTENGFRLQTALGGPIGTRLITNARASGKPLPPMQADYRTEIEAMRAALDWNLYFKEKPCKRKSKR